MQLYTTDENPVICAMALDDWRLRRQLQDTSRIVCTIMHTDNSWTNKASIPYKPIKPANYTRTLVWATDYSNNSAWTIDYFHALSAEARHRFGRELPSAAALNVSAVSDYYSQLLGRCTDEPVTFYNGAMTAGRGIKFTYVAPTTLAYKMYLISLWISDINKPVFTNRTAPKFYFQHNIACFGYLLNKGALDNPLNLTCEAVKARMGELREALASA